MTRKVTWTRSRIRTLLVQKGFSNFKTYRQIGLTKGFDENKNCIVRITNLSIIFKSLSYEIELSIYKIQNIKVTKDFPYLNILIFTKENEMLEFHIPYYNEIEEENEHI